ncbi:ROK family sugar kinase or transcriptional regulator [Candidatus Syntrophocurvum alkaliphilum]|uniref:ROK family sugar kinase or transcriptional regulator n=1 Tax=Candidatus Syntrophocurvum alkaliphilum TaxID=2293317 RepID=A0A6I6DCP5_9FIRM|nr:ROK family protein [Candidatus Syntrophocurvum alkaliphilum]QGU00372.1 ROK family sugar kinase or transcriptional regulator [Candidatus Syntrophocurvum alkaliphilum]
MIIGVDLGATKILSGIVAKDGAIVKRVKQPTIKERSPKDIVNRIVMAINDLLKDKSLEAHKIEKIVVAAPGPLSYPDGVIYDTPNLKWGYFPLKEELEKRLQKEVQVEHDATTAALGEYFFGQKKQYKHLLYMTVSSGIGGGIIIDGKPYRGINGGAGEFGHMVVEPKGRICGCGRHGCLEACASGTAIAVKAKKLIENGEGLGIKTYKKEKANITAYEVGLAARNGDPEAINLINETAYYLGSGTSNIINIFNPEIFILGGGVIFGLEDLLLESISKYVHNNVYALHRKNLVIKASELGEDIGLLGCAAMALEQ